MLDENLPTFLLRSSNDKPRQNSTFFYSQYGAEFEPAYSLKHLDPDQYASRNRYAVALYDAYNPEVLFAEVLLIPEWTQPTLSAEQIRANGGVTPAPEPILPIEFVIQLYNPDQQITVRYKPGSLTTATTWEFEVPQVSFRAPSASVLDKAQDDPASSALTPRLSLKWKKDGRLSKDLACYLSGRASNPDAGRNKHKEPDITLAILKSLKEVTFYEPNMARVEVEDQKGFEVILLLGAVVIRDVYFGNIRETFHVASDGRKVGAADNVLAPVSSNAEPSSCQPTLPPRGGSGSSKDNRIPPTDPRTQWELDQETERLRKQAAEEERRRRKQEEHEQHQIKKMLDAEEKERRRQQAEVDKETERLKRLYGQEDTSARPTAHLQAGQHFSDPALAGGANQSAYNMTQPNYGFAPPGPYVSGGIPPSTVNLLRPEDPRLKPKTSIFSFRRQSAGQEHSKLTKKRSSAW